jgi:uncharacterized phage-associated protein
MKKKFEACVQAIHFLLNNFGTMDKLKIVKLIYFADKRHLIFGGRTITGDDYMAMGHGPVGSMVFDVLKMNAANFEPEQLCYIRRHIQQVGEHNYSCVGRDIVYDQFSESDQKTLAKIGETFKSWTQWDLVELTHKYPEWTQFEEELTKSLSIPIPLVDLFTTIENDPLGIPQDIVEDSRLMYLGIED